MVENSHTKTLQFFCDGESIKKELTSPYTPQQNVVAERKNCTAVEMAWSMLEPDPYEA